MRALVAVLLVVALAGCGGSDDDNDGGLPKAEFVAQSDAICAKHAATQRSVFASIPPNATARETADIYLERALPDLRAQHEELRALDPPADDRDEIDDLYDDIADALDRLEAQLRDEPEEAIASAEAVFAPLNERLRAYGFVTCSQ